MLKSINKLTLLILKHFHPIYVISTLTFLSELGNFQGEDIINARKNYTSGTKIDFWGGISTLIYSNVPELLFRWQIWLGVAQLCLSTAGLVLLFRPKRKKRKERLTIYAISYLALIFSSQMTRDGLMFSLLCFGFGLLSLSSEKDRNLKLLAVSLFVISLAMSFRPWLSLAIIPLVWLMVKNSPLRLSRSGLAFLVCTLAFLPAVLEIAASKKLNLVKSYPEQQVMIMDLASTYCYTNNSASGLKAKIGLEILTDSENYPAVACQLFRPDTWLSLTEGGGNESSKDIQTKLGLIPPGEAEKAQKLRSIWFDLIVSDPISFLQNKILFAGKLIIGSESRNLNVISKKQTQDKLIAIYRIPYDIAISLHLFSILFILLITLIKPVSNFLRKVTESIELDKVVIAIFFSSLLWLSLSSIAYIGSNGRYMYSLTILSVIFLVRYSQIPKDGRR